MSSFDSNPPAGNLGVQRFRLTSFRALHLFARLFYSRRVTHPEQARQSAIEAATTGDKDGFVVVKDRADSRVVVVSTEDDDSGSGFDGVFSVPLFPTTTPRLRRRRLRGCTFPLDCGACVVEDDEAKAGLMQA